MVYLLRLMIFSIMLAGISSCYREVVIPDKVDDVFEMFVSAEMQDFIYNSRDTVYPINDLQLQLFFHDDPLYLDGGIFKNGDFARLSPGCLGNSRGLRHPLRHGGAGRSGKGQAGLV